MYSLQLKTFRLMNVKRRCTVFFCETGSGMVAAIMIFIWELRFNCYMKTTNASSSHNKYVAKQVDILFESCFTTTLWFLFHIKQANVPNVSKMFPLLSPSVTFLSPSLFFCSPNSSQQEFEHWHSHCVVDITLV